MADIWYASIIVDTHELSLPPAENQGAVGVDLGVSALATLSTGEIFEGPKALRTLSPRLRRLSRSLSRKVKGSRNRTKAKLNLKRIAVSSTVTACGGEGAGPARERGTKPAPVKQESGSEANHG